MEKIVFNNGSVATPTELKDCYIIEPRYFGDNRGFFNPDFILEDMRQLGFDIVYQHNYSNSGKGVLRGMHYQLDPKCQTKIVGVVKGSVIDFAVDIRVGSPTYGKAIAVHLTPYDKNDPESGKQLYVPRGFAHGYLSLEEDTWFYYYIDNKYTPTLEDGIAWDGTETKELVEQALAKYGIKREDLIISEKDQNRVPLAEKNEQFIYAPKVKRLENYNFDIGM